MAKKYTVTEIIDIIQSVTKLNVNYSTIAGIIGKNRSTIANKVKKNLFLDVEEMQKITQYFVERGFILFDDVQCDNFISIPVRDNVTASMGYGCIIDNENQTAVCQISPQLLKSLGANRHTTDIIFGRGDSMFPTINDGDALLIDRSQKEIIDGKIYAVRIDGQLLAKRLQKTPPNKIKVISDNPKYDSFYVDFAKVQPDFDFEIVGRVLLFSRIV